MKLFRKCFLLAMCFLGLVVVAACDDTGTVFHTVEFNSNGGSEVASQTIRTGETAVKPEDPTLQWYDFKGWFTDENLEEEYDFSTPVNKNIKLYAKWQLQEVDDVIEILDVEKPAELLLFEANKKEKENKRTEFKDLTQGYVVGDDNEWVFKPEVSFISVDPITGDWEDTTVSKWNYVVKVYVLRDTQYEELGEETPYIDKVNTENSSVDFSEEAVGHQFKVEVYPEGLIEQQLEKVENYTVSIEIEVVDGYNAYTALDLAYMDNRTGDADGAAEWKAFKEAKGLDVNYAPAAIIFHKNIQVSVENLPTEFFYQEGDEDLKSTDADYERTLGSMRDYTDLYAHVFSDGESFSILGNYFQLSMSSLPVVTRENDEIKAEGTVISHSVLLRFEGSEKGEAFVENISLLGNAPRVQNNLKAGGTILMQVEGPSFKAYNNIATASFMAYMAEQTFAPFVMEKCKAFDSFNCFVYNWGSNQVSIVDCEMKDAGGPVIIQDHVDHETDGTGGNPAVTTITNSDLESYVNGQEGWFTVVQATALVGPVIAMDTLFNPFTKSILSKNTTNDLQYFNFICINKSGESQSPTSVKVQGTLKIDDYDAFDYGATSIKVATVAAVAAQLNAPFFQTSAGGAAWTDAQTGLFSENVSFDPSGNPVLEKIEDPTNPIYQGEYMALYYMGMMIVFEYGTVGATHTPA